MAPNKKKEEIPSNDNNTATNSNDEKAPGRAAAATNASSNNNNNNGDGLSLASAQGSVVRNTTVTLPAYSTSRDPSKVAAANERAQFPSSIASRPGAYSVNTSMVSTATVGSEKSGTRPPTAAAGGGLQMAPAVDDTNHQKKPAAATTTSNDKNDDVPSSKPFAAVSEKLAVAAARHYSSSVTPALPPVRSNSHDLEHGDLKMRSSVQAYPQDRATSSMDIETATVVTSTSTAAVVAAASTNDEQPHPSQESEKPMIEGGYQHSSSRGDEMEKSKEFTYSTPMAPLGMSNHLPTLEAIKVDSQMDDLRMSTATDAVVATAEKDSWWSFFKRSRCAQMAAFFGCFIIVGLIIGLVMAFFNRSIQNDNDNNVELETFFDQIGPNLDGPIVGAEHGSSISLSETGNRMAVADAQDVYIYDLEQEAASDGTMTMDWLLVATIQAPENATLGEPTHRHDMVRTSVQVDLSDDGNFLAIGWPYSANEDGLQPSIGRVEVYQDQGAGIWTRLGNVMYGWSTSDFFGTSVSLSGTGGSVAVGAPGNNGHADIFLLNQDRWVKQGDFVTLEGTLLAGSVSIDKTGQTFAVGGHPVSDDNFSAAVVRIFRFTAGNWEELGNGIVGNFQDTAYLTALSADGNIVAVSNYYRGEAGPKEGELNDALDVRAFEWDGQDWVQMGTNLHALAPGEKSGYFITLSNDGTLMGMGDPGRENMDGGGVAGHAHIYQYNQETGEWQQRGPNKDGEAPGDQFGFAVSLSGDGTKFATGAPFNRGEGVERGRVSVFDIDL